MDANKRELKRGNVFVAEALLPADVPPAQTPAAVW
jgi:hypothetical protein